VAVSRSLDQHLQPGGQLARLESDEFLIVQPCRADQLEQRARAIQLQLLGVDREHPHLPVVPRFSIGAAHAPSHGDTALGLMQAANTALMEAKKQGSASFCTYTSTISERIKQRVALEAELQRALQRDEQSFHLAFQPQVNQQGAIVGAEVLLSSLERHQLSSEDLELEITETALLRDQEGSQAETHALSKAGFQIAIDDFGTGFASLVCLHTLPLHKIKIDISFVQRMEHDPVALAIVRSTILLAHELKLQALAEGVETEAQWQMLRDQGCDLFQGYLFGYPMPADAFADRLNQQRPNRLK
jgi:predicted signal transduction protein with EAL and GGDEF domain